MADIFISYASEDREWVRKLAITLEESGWSVWWDRNIIAGQAFDQVIEHELEIAKSVVVVWSKNSVSSEWVKNEASVASDSGLLVPIQIDHVQVPLEFRRKQTADLVGWDGSSSHEGLQMMKDGLVEITKKIEKNIPQQKSTLHWIKKLLVNHRLYLIIVGLIGVVLGLVIYILNISTLTNKTADIDIKQSAPIIKTILTERNTIDESEVAPILNSKIELLKLSEKTVFPGVTAYVNRFENTGGLITLEITLKNMTSKAVKVCANGLRASFDGIKTHGARLIDEVSGKKVHIEYYGGEIKCTEKISLVKDGTHIIWMKFKIKNSDTMKFTFDWHILKRPLEGLVVKNNG